MSARIPLFKVAMDEMALPNVSRVLASGYIGQGPVVDKFEHELETAFGLSQPPLTVNSCTSAIDLALHLSGVGPGDEVISTPLTCTATNSHVIHRGATLIWADVNADTGLIDPMAVRASVTSRTKAVIAVDWGGVSCDYDQLREAVGPDLPIIQDAAHTLGKWSVNATFTAWSFQAIKHLTTGDGGGLRVPANLYERAKLLRWFGLDRTSSASFRCGQNISEVGFKYHMNDIAAAIGIANLSLAWHNVALHQFNAGVLTAAIHQLPHLPRPRFSVGDYWIYFLHTPRRDDFISFMDSRGIEAGLVHSRNDSHRAFRARSRWLSPPFGLDLYSDTYVAIPCGWWVGPDELKRITDALEAWNAQLCRNSPHPND